MAEVTNDLIYEGPFKPLQHQLALRCGHVLAMQTGVHNISHILNSWNAGWIGSRSA